MKYVKLSVLFFALIVGLSFFFSEETHAAGYDVTLNGVIIYLSKDEATRMAHNLEQNADNTQIMGLIAAWIPNALYQRISVGAAGLTSLRMRAIARQLLRCSNRGARLTIPWPIGLGGAARPMLAMQVASR